MYIRRKVFSILTDEMGEERLYSVNETVFEGYEEREFGMKSKALAAFLPGAYQAKEAAKYAYDEDDYKKKRGNYALRGAFTPGTATYIKKKVEKMADEGASKEEIRNYLEKKGYDNHLIAGIGEVVAAPLTGGMSSSIASLTAQGVGLADKLSGRRANNKKDKNKKK